MSAPELDFSGWTGRRFLFLGVSGVLLLALLIWASPVLLPFIMAMIVAFVLTPLVSIGERARLPRPASIILVYLVVFGSLYASVAALAPRMYAEADRFTRDAPVLLTEATRTWGPQAEAWVEEHAKAPPGSANSSAIELVPRKDGGYRLELGSGIEIVQETERQWRVVAVDDSQRTSFSFEKLMRDGLEVVLRFARNNVVELIRLGQSVVSSVSRGIFLLFMTLMVAGYIMQTREAIFGFLASLLPFHARSSFDRLLLRMERGLSGVVRGQLLICLVNGVLSAIGFWMFGLKYWPILSIVAGVMSIVPIFGSILSTVPAVLVGLTQSPWIALWVLVWVLGIHQVEANFLNPKIIGVAAKIHPVLVVFSLVVGEHFFGLWGALLAVPALSVVQSLFNHFRFEALPDAPRDSIAAPPLVPESEADR
ncbi:MAG: AI-2E family transporter [Polyangiaceae bacterium]|nr:AI-2E family transporter [Polyangiaceae bacterium]